MNSSIITLVAMALTLLFNFWYKKNNKSYAKAITIWNTVSSIITQAVVAATATNTAAPTAVHTSMALAAVTATVSLGSSFFANLGSFVLNTAIQTFLTTGIHSWFKNFKEGVATGFNVPPAPAAPPAK